MTKWGRELIRCLKENKQEMAELKEKEAFKKQLMSKVSGWLNQLDQDI